jgi:hypothetical protein
VPGREGRGVPGPVVFWSRMYRRVHGEEEGVPSFHSSSSLIHLGPCRARYGGLDPRDDL